MKKATAVFSVCLVMAALCAVPGSAQTTADRAGELQTMTKTPIIFATYASDDQALYWALVMAESIRQFGGDMRNAPIWVYRPEGQPDIDSMQRKKQETLAVILKTIPIPEDAQGAWFAGKVNASAAAETDAEGKGIILAWLDPDEIFVKEPKEFLLPDSVSFGYRPVMHKLIGSLYSEPPDEFWSRVYARLSVPESAVFPVVSPLDQLTLRAYFNAGILIVRPERGLLRRWPGCFRTLYSDSVFAEWCRTDQLRAIFLHQAALAGDVLTLLKQSETMDLPSTYNYPAYFHDRYPAETKPKSLDDVVMFRHEFFASGRGFMDITTITDAKIVDWVRQRLPRK
ncbi:MAG: hypothetical protein PHR28_04870 [candidate division Zixibacteria bacterium]|nr:hypothetical protein [candidate division Zixibacteria bacterium]